MEWTEGNGFPNSSRFNPRNYDFNYMNNQVLNSSPVSYNQYPAANYHPNNPQMVSHHDLLSKLQHQRKLDAEFIAKFTAGKKIHSHCKNAPVLKIFEAKDLITELFTLKKEIEILINEINVKDSSFDAQWELIIEKQGKICNLLSRFDEAAVKSLKDSLKKREKKRKSNKTRKLKMLALKKENEEKRKEKHRIIDEILKKKSEEVEALKQEQSMKRQADIVLHEVTKKKSEAKKTLNMLTALTKLRELRVQQEIAQGGYSSQQLTETFNGVINRFQELWKKQLEIYQLEEKGLKVMLEETALTKVKQSKSQFQVLLHAWEQALFGNDCNDELNKLMTKADYDLNALIQVRREWDQFLVTVPTIMASSIPQGWIVPPETANNEWKAFIKKRKRNFD